MASLCHVAEARLRPSVVDNPFFSRAHPADASNPRTIPAAVNVRESAITMLASRGALDAAQVKAADHFRTLWETLGGKGASSIDPGRIVVDAGKMPEGISQRQIDAGQELRRCRALLGARGYALVSLVCGQGMALHEIAASKRERLTAADMLRWCLDDLAALWGIATRRR
ncbi:hypothetical protein EOB36_25505 [Mesorhizobium sp. M6A.T.Cr.TU.017.01.1.1]|uniref:hypothetical protein n=1 Tax=Mesorhizobium sp. M6A.T.Cr.TU.017.01.1.1 TaxID=2496774 RepID=UPI000FD544D1|nr:hypothetical protein [Mesorhizobium sp. M6A.T.Cr.TU.017.01.1.1]RUU97861.1 hypothetical protein EOB36_25505 [Mesorhizobium sp. M6A.T.Cr.TU.017.01.1.1]